MTTARQSMRGCRSDQDPCGEVEASGAVHDATSWRRPAAPSAAPRCRDGSVPRPDWCRGAVRSGL